MPAKRIGPERFSDRVENYIRYRPDYPPAVIDVLQREIGLTPTWVIAIVTGSVRPSSFATTWRLSANRLQWP